MPKKKTETTENKKTKSKKIETFEFGGVTLPMWDGKKNHPLIPTTGADIWYEESDMQAIATAVKENIACLLIGETGTGKTSVLRQMAYERNQPYVRVNLNGYTAPDELIGSKSAQDGSTYFEEGVMIKAMREGAILVFDEINATPPDCLFAIHSLLDDEKKVTLPTGTVVTPHPEFRFFATMNPDYEGTKSVNKALADRFGIVLDIKPLDPNQEQKYLEKYGVDNTQATNMVAFGQRARKAYYEQTIPTFISTRTLLQWAELVKKGMDFEDAFKFSILGKINQAFKTAVNDLFYSVMKESPASDESGWEIVKSAELEKLKNDLKKKTDNIKRMENDWAVKKADYVQKNQNLINQLQTEKNQSTKLKSIVKQLRGLDMSAFDDVIEDGEVVNDKS